MTAKQTIEFLLKKDWLQQNIPPGFDFRLPQDQIDPVMFGLYFNQSDPNQCKVVCGGQALAEETKRKLAELGIEGSAVKSGAFWQVEFRV